MRSVAHAVAFYHDRLGFLSRHEDTTFAVLARDDVEIILWQANDPSTPGAEPHLAGSASCRIRVANIHNLYETCQGQSVIHPNSTLKRQSWGDEDFAVLDLDGNQLGFYEPVGDSR